MLSIKKHIIQINVLLISLFVLISVLANICMGTTSFMDFESSVKLLLSQIEENRKKLVLISVYDSSGALNTGSGVFIDNDGRILTNASLFSNAYSAEVYSEHNHYTKVEIINRDDIADMAIIKVKAVNEVPIEPDYEFERRPGARVTVLGKSPAFKTTVSAGFISSVNSMGKAVDIMKIEVPGKLINYKHSENGIVINKEGNLIGVITQAALNDGSDLVRREYYGDKLTAVNIGHLKPLLTGPAEIVMLRPPGEKIWLHWFLRQVRENAKLSFITLYDLGFNKIINFLIAFALIIGLFLWLINNLRKTIKTRLGR